MGKCTQAANVKCFRNFWSPKQKKKGTHIENETCERRGSTTHMSMCTTYAMYVFIYIFIICICMCRVCRIYTNTLYSMKNTLTWLTICWYSYNIKKRDDHHHHHHRHYHQRTVAVLYTYVVHAAAAHVENIYYSIHKVRMKCILQMYTTNNAYAFANAKHIK